MFGVPAKLGLENTDLPPELLPQMTQEDEVSEALEEMQDTPCAPMDDNSTSCAVNAGDSLSNRAQAIIHERENANKALEQQAKRMKRDSDAKFPEVDVGTSVRVPVPYVDRGKTDAR